MNQNVDSDPPDWVEWVQNPHGICRTEPENVLSFAYHHECLKWEIFVTGRLQYRRAVEINLPLPFLNKHHVKGCSKLNKL
jgi:hypothetical protein